MRALCLHDPRGGLLPRVQNGLPSCSGDVDKAPQSEPSPSHCGYLHVAFLLSGHPAPNTQRWTVREPRHHLGGCRWPLFHHATGHTHSIMTRKRRWAIGDRVCKTAREARTVMELTRFELTGPNRLAEVARARFKQLRLLRRRGSPAGREELRQLMSHAFEEVVVSVFLCSIVSLFKSITAPTCLSWDIDVRSGTPGLSTAVYLATPLTPPVREGISSLPNILAVPPMPTAWLPLLMTRGLSPNWWKRTSLALPKREEVDDSALSGGVSERLACVDFKAREIGDALPAPVKRVDQLVRLQTLEESVTEPLRFVAVVTTPILPPSDSNANCHQPGASSCRGSDACPKHRPNCHRRRIRFNP